ncbi:uncharacterized protein LOC108141751 [Drosophila elegans]|uniref:uncharacterized protein LOC108141751 n=1 Tax=Drosophila elegans TaxID=30023 RepID=UPI0007E5EDBD|nr:uncharacterized protein LOC108141751 [Drosophila elegans]
MPENENGISESKFAGVTLLILSICLLVAFPQWLLLCIFADNHLLFTMSCFFLSVLLLACIHLLEPLKYSRPWNFIAIAICYELLTLGAASFLMEWSLIHTIIIIAVALMFLVLSLLICFLLIWTGFFANPFKVAVVGAMGFVLAFCITQMDVLVAWFFWRDVAIGVFIFSVILVMICHVLITYNNFEVLVKDDALLVGIVLYVIYLLLVLGCRVSANCINRNIIYYKGTTAENGDINWEDDEEDTTIYR